MDIIGGRRSGKSVLFAQMKEFALQQGKRVLVWRQNGSYIERRHKSGLSVITPIKPGDVTK